MLLPVVKELIGENWWPTTVIMGWVHWDEPSWVGVVKHFMDTLSIQYGKVFLILANPQAINNQERYCSFNLNRAFDTSLSLPQYEQQCVDLLCSYLDQADYLLDLHNTVKNKSPRFLITENPHEYSHVFDVEYVVSGLTKTHFWSTDEYMERNNKVGLCLECWRTQWDPSDNEQFAKDNTLSFLSHVWHFWENLRTRKKEKKQKILDFSYLYRAQERFISKKKFADFEHIVAGECIGYDWSKKIVASEDCYILFCEKEASTWEEWFLLTWKTVFI